MQILFHDVNEKWTQLKCYFNSIPWKQMRCFFFLNLFDDVKFDRITGNNEIFLNYFVQTQKKVFEKETFIQHNK